jgi:hypothetical protein
MRNMGFLIFVSIVLIIYSAANYYLFLRGYQAFSFSGMAKKWYVAFGVLIPMTFVAGIFLERAASSAFSEWVYRIGAFWLAFMLYFTLILILIDMIRIADYFFHFLPTLSPVLKTRIALAVILIVTSIVVIGYFNTVFVKVNRIPLKIGKKVDGNPKIRILMASDLHLGALVRLKKEEKLLEIIKKEKPDLVLLCGDLVDSEIAPVLRKNLGSHIREIETPLGVYAITGNHEYIGGIDKTLPYLKSIGINMLIDSTITLSNGIQLIGRNDISAGGFGQGFRTKPLSKLMEGFNPEKPVIVMNHQPYNLSEASDLGVDLHLSGHTHNGQMWPLNYITGMVYELDWGYLKKANTHFYVSCGFGTWGPSVRIGSQSEVVLFDVTFE